MKNQTIVGALWRRIGQCFYLGAASGGAAVMPRGFDLFTVVLWAVALFALALAVAALFGYVPFGHVADPLALALNTPAAPAAARPTVSFSRKYEPTKAFQNVAAGADATHPATCFTLIPNYPRTLLGVILNLTGTSFLKSDITRIEVFMGEKSIWGPVSGSDLDAVNRYVDGEADRDANFLPVMFTLKNVKEIGGEFIGGLDLTQLQGALVRMEVDIASTATAPGLSGETIWGAPQGGGPFGGMMLKLLKRKYAQMNSGDNFPVVDLKGAIVCRQFVFYTVATAAVSAAQGINNGANTGNGVMGAITVSAQTLRGRYILKVTVAAANAGTFVVWDPNGKVVGTGTVAVAFTQGGLSFTLADGAADFVAGDGFTIDVLPTNTDGNLNLIEVKKNEDVWWSYTDRRASFMEKKFGRSPLTQMMPVDFLLDNHADSVLDTAGAQLDYKMNLTTADTLTVIHQILADPTQF